MSKGGICLRYVNLHNHTVYSDGIHTMEENIKSAIQKGMYALGFSDHSYTPCDESYCMKPGEYSPYLQEISQLKGKYKDCISLYAGIELDYDSDPDTTAFDYTIASVHYITRGGKTYAIDHSLAQQELCCKEVFGGDKLAMAKCYFDQLISHVKRCNPTFVGHFDVITKFSYMPEEDPRYQEIAAAALEEIVKVCPYIEVNTGAIARKCRATPYPARFLLEKMLLWGAKPVLGSDSHKVENLTFWFDEAVALLKEVGFPHIAQYNGEGFDDQII